LTYLILASVVVGLGAFLWGIAYLTQSPDRALLAACPLPEVLPNHELALAAKELKFFYQDYERLPLAEQAAHREELNALVNRAEQVRSKTQGDYQAFAQAGEAWVTAWRDFDEAFKRGGVFSRSFWPSRMQDLQCFRSHFLSCERRYRSLAERLKTRERVWLKEGQHKAQGLDLTKLIQELQSKGLFSTLGGLPQLQPLLPQVTNFTLTEASCDFSQLPQPLARLRISNSRFVGALLTGPASFQDCLFTEVDFSHSRLSQLTFLRCRFVGCSFCQAQATEVSFFSCEFSQSELTSFTLTACKLVETQFPQSSLSPGNIKDCSLCTATRLALEAASLPG